MAKQEEWHVIDVDFDEIVHIFKTKPQAQKCANDMNKGKLEKMYKVERANT